MKTWFYFCNQIKTETTRKLTDRLLDKLEPQTVKVISSTLVQCPEITTFKNYLIFNKQDNNQKKGNQPNYIHIYRTIRLQIMISLISNPNLFQ